MQVITRRRTRDGWIPGTQVHRVSINVVPENEQEEGLKPFSPDGRVVPNFGTSRWARFMGATMEEAEAWERDTLGELRDLMRISGFQVREGPKEDNHG